MFMEQDAEVQWPSRTLYARAVSAYSDAVTRGASSWESSWCETIAVLLPVITAVGVSPHVGLSNKQAHDKHQAIFQAVVRTLRASNDELDAAWRATMGREGKRTRWQWRGVGRHVDSKLSSSRPKFGSASQPAYRGDRLSRVVDPCSWALRPSFISNEHTRHTGQSRETAAASTDRTQHQQQLHEYTAEMYKREDNPCSRIRQPLLLRATAHNDTAGSRRARETAAVQRFNCSRTAAGDSRATP